MFGSKKFGSRAGITQSGGLFERQLLNGITSRKRGLAAEYSSKWRQRCSHFGLFLETNFTRKTCTLEAEANERN